MYYSFLLLNFIVFDILTHTEKLYMHIILLLHAFYVRIPPYLIF